MIDFGIAKEIGSQATKTAYQALTPMFAAPERQDGESDYNPVLSDIFETGVTLYNFATNDLPYRNPANPNHNEWGGEAANKLSPEFKRVLKKATHPLPEMRYKNAGDLAQDFASLKKVYGGDEPVKKKKSRTGLTIAIALVAVLIVVGYFTKNYWLPYYDQLTATNSNEQTDDKPEPELEAVIDSIIGEDEVHDSGMIAENIADTNSTIVTAVDNAKEAGEEPVKIATKQEIDKPVVSELEKTVKKDESIKPAEEPKKEVVQKPKDEDSKPVVVEDPRNAMIVNTIPQDIHLLRVDTLEASKDSTFMLKYGNHSVAVYHPDYPIYRKTVYMSKTSRTVEIDLKEENLATAKATLQIAMSPAIG